jgi:hypothetical protein
MPLRYYRYCLGRHDYFAMTVARTVLAAPLLSVIFVALGRAWVLLMPTNTFGRYPNVFALMSYGGWLSEFAWGATELCGGVSLLAASAVYLMVDKPAAVRRSLWAMAALLCWQAILSAGTVGMVVFADPASPVWVWFGLRFALASLAFFQVVCVLQGECGGLTERRLELLSRGTNDEQRKRLAEMPDEELRREYSEYQQRAAMR